MVPARFQARSTPGYPPTTRSCAALPKDHPALRAKARGRWYVPDPNKAADVEMRRTRILLREFDEYRQSPQRRLKLFRLEAVRAGFFKAYQDRDYETIIKVAEKIPEAVLQEDQKLPALVRPGADADGRERMTITRLKLERFTAFKNLEFKPSRGINVLVGANGTGKTHLMKVCLRGLRREQDRQQLRRKAHSCLHAVGTFHRATRQAARKKLDMRRQGLPQHTTTRAFLLQPRAGARFGSRYGRITLERRTR